MFASTNLEEAYDGDFSSVDEFLGSWDVCEPYGFPGSAETICRRTNGWRCQATHTFTQKFLEKFLGSN